MENNNSESTVVLNVNHPPFDLKNKSVVADEELQNVKSVESSAAEKDDSEIKNEVNEIKIENRIELGIIKRKPSPRDAVSPFLQKLLLSDKFERNVNSEDSEIKSEADDNKNKNRNQLRIQRKESPNNLHPIIAPAIPDNFSLSNSFMKFFQSPLLKEILPMIDEVFRTLVENTKSIEGAKVENLKLFVSLNYRNVDEKNWHKIAQCVHDVNKNNPRLQLTHQPKISREQIFAVINFIVEVPTLVFEQLSSKNQILYGVLAMSFSIVTVIFSIAEFIYRGRTKAGAVWRWRRIPWLHYLSPSKTKLFGSVTDVIGLVGAILQFIFSGIAILFLQQTHG